MTPDKKLQKEVVDAFTKVEDAQSLLQLLNSVKGVLYPEKSQKPFMLKQLYYYAFGRSVFLTNAGKGNATSYTIYAIAKKSGGSRTVYAPIASLKVLQRCLAFVFQCIYQPHPSAKGFLWGKSVIDNARIHLNQDYVFNIDLKDFFPSIPQARVWKKLQLPPFNLVEPKEASFVDDMVDSTQKIEVDETSEAETAADRTIAGKAIPGKEEVARLIAGICCVRIKGEKEGAGAAFLPQGAPTSPVLSNIICERLDRRLQGLAKKYGLRYTRYADDITFSGGRNVFRKSNPFRIELERLITLENFQIQEAKVRLQKRGQRQEVTGVVVNEKLNVPRVYVERVRQYLYFWERYGYERATAYFEQRYTPKQKLNKTDPPALQDVLLGKLCYLQMVKGKGDPTLEKLWQRYKALMTPVENTAIKGDLQPSMQPETVSQYREALNKLMTLWENGEITAEEAMKRYEDLSQEQVQPKKKRVTTKFKGLKVEPPNTGMRRQGPPI